MIKKFERIISNTQSNYKVVIRKKEITQQCSYNLPVELEAYLLNLNALKRETDESVKTKVKYVLSPAYHAVLGVNICAIIGSEYLQKRVSVIFTHTEGEDGGTPKFQLKKTDFKSKGIGYEWFVDLYNKNIEGVNFTVSVDDEKKEIMFDVELTSNVIDMTEVEDDSINTQDLLEEFSFKESTITDGQNLIVYGTPGCGKSYYVEHTLLDGYSKENYIRTTFYQDYTNTDFVGQILPVVEGDKVTYKFNPGPFTLALEQAIRKPNERIALVIEELNRGSAASIFGDIFQLLDRKEGVSEYGITNVNIINYLKEKFEGVYTFKEIRLPGNLSIYATMNTSDQNVFTLDTAFKRRWKFKKLINEFAKDHQFKNKFIPGADITWEDLVNAINEYILECSSGLNSEDKQIGVYFVDENGMRKEKFDASDPEAVNAFAYKVLEYLWSDVAKFDRSKWFTDGIKSLDELVKEYKNKGLEVFVDGIFNK